MGAGFSEASSGLASAMGRALVVADSDDSTPAKAAAAITAPTNFNTTLNLRPQPRKAVLETRRPLRQRAALSIQKVSAQTVCRRSLRMPTSHVLAVCASTHSDYRGQRLYRAGYTSAESTCANVSLSKKCEILGHFCLRHFCHRVTEFFSLRLSLQCHCFCEGCLSICYGKREGDWGPAFGERFPQTAVLPPDHFFIRAGARAFLATSARGRACSVVRAGTRRIRP